MNISEKELQDSLMKKEFFRSNENYFEKQIMFGCKEFSIGDNRIDILGYDDEGNIYIIELKKGTIDGNALTQVLSYGFLLKELLEVNNIEHFEIRHVLVGSDIDNRTSKCVIGLKNVCFTKYELDVHFESFDNIFDYSYFENLKSTSLEISKLIDNRTLEE